MACPSLLTNLVVIDPAVNNHQMLLQDVLLQVEVLVLDANRDGITQMTEVLANYTGVEYLHIIAAANSNGLRLGSSELTLFNLERYGWQLQQWGNSFAPNAQILIYGCYEADPMAISSLSTPFLNRLRLLTGAEVTVPIHLIHRAAWFPSTLENRSDSVVMG